MIRKIQEFKNGSANIISGQIMTIKTDNPMKKHLCRNVGEMKTRHLLYIIVVLLLIIIFYLINLSTTINNIDWDVRNILGKVAN